MLEILRGAVLVAATVGMGLSAGLFYAFTISVMPGLARTDTRTLVDAMQQINVAILNGWFWLSFLGAPTLTALAAVLHLRGEGPAVLPWIVAALVLCVMGIVITMAANVPLNNTLAAAGPRDRIADLAAVRQRFETAWVRWNLARTLVYTGAFCCLTWALVLYGRVTATA